MANAPQWGYTCFNFSQCRTECSAPTEIEAEAKVIAEGWRLGLDSSGQAHYSCAGCAPALFDSHPIYPLLSGRASGGLMQGEKK